MLYRSMPTSPLFSLRQEIDRLFDDTVGGGTTRRGWLPTADVRESGREYTFELELPGVAPEQVEVTADNGVLTVRGEKAQQSRKEDEEGRYHFTERTYGSFVRAFQLPQGVEEDGIAATFDHGVLSIRVPKAQRPQPRKIQVNTGDGDQRLGSGETGAAEAQRSDGATASNRSGGANASNGSSGRGRSTAESSERQTAAAGR